MMAVSVEGLDCQHCSEEMKKDRGCVDDAAIPGRWEIDGVKYQRCPLKIITPQSYNLIQAYWLFKMRFLPNGTGWLNETSKFITAMQTIDRYVRWKEVKDAKRQ